MLYLDRGAEYTYTLNSYLIFVSFYITDLNAAAATVILLYPVSGHRTYDRDLFVLDVFLIFRTYISIIILICKGYATTTSNRPSLR